jgi:hypothetical protein
MWEYGSDPDLDQTTDKVSVEDNIQDVQVYSWIRIYNTISSLEDDSDDEDGRKSG